MDLASAVTSLLNRSDSIVGPKPTVVIKSAPTAGNTNTCTVSATTCDYCVCGSGSSRCSGGHCCY